MEEKNIDPKHIQNNYTKWPLDVIRLAEIEQIKIFDSETHSYTYIYTYIHTREV